MEHLLKSKKEYKKSEKTGDSRYIYQNEFDKLCFQHNMAYGDFKDLAKKKNIYIYIYIMMYYNEQNKSRFV